MTRAVFDFERNVDWLQFFVFVRKFTPFVQCPYARKERERESQRVCVWCGVWVRETNEAKTKPNKIREQAGETEGEERRKEREREERRRERAWCGRHIRILLEAASVNDSPHDIWEWKDHGAR